MNLAYYVGFAVSVVACLLSIKLLSMSLFGFAFIALLPVLGFTYSFCRKKSLSDGMKWTNVLIQTLITLLCFAGIVMVDPIFADHSLTVVDTAEGAQAYIVQTAMLSARSLDPRRSLEQLVQNANIIRNYDPQSRLRRATGVSIFQHNHLTDFFGYLPEVNHPEIANRTLKDIIRAYQTIFEELPPHGFDSAFKNPCWHGEGGTGGGHTGAEEITDANAKLHCLPYVYLLGQPKSGTTDLYLHLSKHPDFVNPRRKEVRFFTRGEFIDPPPLEDIPLYGTGAGSEGEDASGRRKLLLWHEGQDKEALESGSIPKHGHVDIGSEGRRAKRSHHKARGSKHHHNQDPNAKHKYGGGVEEGATIDSPAGNSGDSLAGLPLVRRSAEQEAEKLSALQFTSNHKFSSGGSVGHRGGGGDSNFLDEKTSLLDFSDSFGEIAKRLTHAHSYGGGADGSSAVDDRSRLIALDGGPHTLWWPLQKPDGTYTRNTEPHTTGEVKKRPGDFHPSYLDAVDVNIPQLLAAIQPNAKFIITVSDPVNRLYSDYYFLGDDLRPVKHKNKKMRKVHGWEAEGDGGDGLQATDAEKSPEHFHNRAVSQVAQMRACIDEHMLLLPKWRLEEGVEHTDQQEHVHGMGWFRASQVCAHDRMRFGRGGWGRLSIGMYAVFLEKWLEHFYSDQFLVLKLEDMDQDPRAYFTRIFEFLGTSIPESDSEWSMIIDAAGKGNRGFHGQTGAGADGGGTHHANAHQGGRLEMLPETRAVLEEFYQPYNAYLARYLQNDAFLWDLDAGISSAQGGAGLPSLVRINSKGVLAGLGSLSESLESQARALLPESASKAASKGMETVLHFAGNRSDSLKSWLGSNVAALQLQIGSGASSLSASSGSKSGVGARPPPRGSLLDGDSAVSDPGLRGARTPPLHRRGANHDANANTDADARNGGADAVHYQYQGQNQQHDVVTSVQVCDAVIELNATRLQELLDSGPLAGRGLVNWDDSDRTPLFCLAGMYLLADASGKSLVFSVLKGKGLGSDAEYYDPPLPTKAASVDSLRILNSMSKTLRALGEVLFNHPGFKAEVNINQRDSGGNTALHVAASGGIPTLVSLLLDHGADVLIANRDGRLPLHFAAALGHAEAAAALLKVADMKTQLHTADKIGVTPENIIMMPGGPILSSDFKKYFPSLPARRAIRKIAAVPAPTEEETEIGGWSTERMADHPRSADYCDVDMYYAHEITPDEVFVRYTSTLTPILIRGLLHNEHDTWPAYERYTRENLMRINGAMKVTASTIPYAEKFGGEEKKMTLGAYIESVHEHRMLGGKHPYCKFINITTCLLLHLYLCCF